MKRCAERYALLLYRASLRVSGKLLKYFEKVLQQLTFFEIRDCYIIDFIVHVSSHFLQSTLHCLCFISFPSVHTSLFMLHLISFSPHFIVHVPSHFLQSTLHWSCFIPFLSVHTSLFMFHFIAFSPHLIVHVSSYFLQSTVHLIYFIYHSPSSSLFGCVHITWSFNFIVSFTF